MTDVRALETEQHTVTLNSGGEHAFEGVRLGRGTSHRKGHINHAPSGHAAKGDRCSGCRWTTTVVYWSASDDSYLVWIVGKSIVPGEVDKPRVAWCGDADAVLDALLVAPPKRFQRREANPGYELPQPNADALEEAAGVDPALARVLAGWESGS